MKFDRITVDPRQMGGVPCVRGLRIPVATVVGMVADGMVRAKFLRRIPTYNQTISTRRCVTPPKLFASAGSHLRLREVSHR